MAVSYNQYVNKDGDWRKTGTSRWVQGGDEKQDLITAQGILKGDGMGGVSAAVAGVDYAPVLAVGSPTAFLTKTTKYRYIWHDNFHRADGQDLGTNGDTKWPMTYFYAGSQLVISNDACINSGTTNGQAYADMGYSDCIIEFQADLSDCVSTARGFGVLFRRTSSTDFLYCQLRRTNIRFGKAVNGETTELKYIELTSIEKAPVKISVVLNGPHIAILTNGIEAYSTICDVNVSSTVHGILMAPNDTGTNLGKLLNFAVKVPMDWQPMIDQMDSGELPYDIVVENAGESYNFAIQGEVVNNSNTALRFENRKADNYRRSEIAIRNHGRMLDEQFFTWDTMLGEDYAVVDPTDEIIMQIHDTPDAGTSVGVSPVFSIFIKDGEYYVKIMSSPYKTSYDITHMASETANMGSYLADVGKWVRWTLHIKWAYNNFFEPITELFKDGNLVFRSTQPNVINAASSPYFKVGMYTYNWVEHPDDTVANVRTMYVDNINLNY